MTSSNKILLGRFIYNLAMTLAMCYCVWQTRDVPDLRIRVMNHQHPANEESSVTKAPTPTPEWGLISDAPAAEPTNKTAPAESPKPRFYTVGKKESLTKPAMADGIVCWPQRQAWNKSWLQRNPLLVAHNRRVHQLYPKVNDYTVRPKDVIVLPTLEEIARIKATVHCRGG